MKASTFRLHFAQSNGSPKGRLKHPRQSQDDGGGGGQVCNRHGGPGMVRHKADMVVALHALTYFREPLAAIWSGRRLLLDRAPL